MAEGFKCPVTGFPAVNGGSSGDYLVVNCSALRASYEISGTALEMLKHWSAEERAKVATYIIDERQLGSTRPHISSTTLERVAMRRNLGVMERVHRFYRLIADMSPEIGTSFAVNGPATEGVKTFLNAAVAHTESKSHRELGQFIRYGREAGHFPDNAAHVLLTVKGWEYVERLKGTDRSSAQGFVAMWFGAEMSDAFESGIAPAIIESGYSPMRIDQKEHSNRIDDEIIAEIRRSRFLVADFTCGLVTDGKKETAIPRGGVYYEAGFAQGLGIPVIWMCRQDHIDHVHFDTRQFNHITWTDASDLRVKLKNRIGAVLGDGPNVRP